MLRSMCRIVSFKASNDTCWHAPEKRRGRPTVTKANTNMKALLGNTTIHAQA